MSTADSLADLLRLYLDEVGWSERQLAQRSNIPRGTIRNWLSGAVRSPRDWRDVIHVAAAMRLSMKQTDALLKASHDLSLAQLWDQTEKESDHELLAPWQTELSARQSEAPFLVIADLPYFVGRQTELAAIQQALTKARHPPVYVLHGMAGVGKTALAVRAAYRLRSHFADGVLWARVDTSDSMSILQFFAAAYGHDVSQYADLGSRSQVVRGILAQKHVLLVLDNVESSQQIEPLLPPTGQRAVLLTTRQQDLRIAHGSPHFHITPFAKGEQETLHLFAKFVKEADVQAQQPVFSEMADLLGHLPLAIAMVANQIAYSPTETAVHFLEQLREEKYRLDTLTDEDQSVRTSFNVSYRRLSKTQQHLFATLGVFAGEDFDVEAVTAVAREPLPETRKILAALSHLSLVETSRRGRFRLHPLLRDYVREQIRDDQSHRRMVEYYVNFTEAYSQAFDRLSIESDNALGALEVAWEMEMWPEHIRGTLGLARFWWNGGLHDTALIHLKRARKQAEALADIPHLVEILNQMGHIAELRRNLTEAEQLFQEALSHAQRAELSRLIIMTMQHIGRVWVEQEAYERAETILHRSLEIAQAEGFTETICHALNHLAALAVFHRGDYAGAVALYEEGLILTEKEELWLMNNLILYNLGSLSYRMGTYTMTDTYLQQGIAVAQKIGHRSLEGLLIYMRGWLIWSQSGDIKRTEQLMQQGMELQQGINQRAFGYIQAELGVLVARVGKYETANAHLQAAMQAHKEVDESGILALSCLGLGILAAAEANQVASDQYFQQAMDLVVESGDPWNYCRVLQEWGETQLEQGRLEASYANFEKLAEIARQVKLEGVYALALYGLARLHQLQGEHAVAAEYGRGSTKILRRIGHYQAVEVTQWLQTTA